MLKGKKILITGVSSGIGKALTIKLVKNGNMVWGVARRKELLLELSKSLQAASNFFYSGMDVSEIDSWKRLISFMSRKNFVPEIIIFSAAINFNDLNPPITTDLTRKMFEVNFFSILYGVENLLKYVRLKTQFVLLSTAAALKGSVREMGYSASKAAISSVFEGLYQKYQKKYLFKTVYLGPVATGMNPFRKSSLLTLSEKSAVEKIIAAVESEKILFFYPKIIFLFMRIIKLLPSGLYFRLLFFMEKTRFRLENEGK